MIVWIDGTFGVGKSSVAEELHQSSALPNTVLLDSDEYYLPGLSSGRYFGGGMMAQNNIRFLTDFKNLIETEASKPDSTVIVAMALTENECRDYLLLPLSSLFPDSIHIILTAETDTIYSRIRTDGQRDQSFATQHLNRNLKYLRTNYPQANWINTDRLTTTETAGLVIALIEKHS